MMKVVRQLNAQDRPALERFLESHADSSMFLRSNLARAGFADSGEVYQACYAASLHDQALTAVVAHYWNGMLTFQAPQNLAAVTWLAVAASGRKVTGLSGPLDQVEAAREVLGLEGVDCGLDHGETLYGLDLADLRVPDVLASGSVICRRPRASELDILANWRSAYAVEALGARDSSDVRRESRIQIERNHREARHWIVERGGQIVAYSAFNAGTAERVQIGGVWTPAGLRGRGYARAAVAGSLLAARDEGVDRAVLFAENPAAKRAYEALGFSRIGHYGLIMLAEAQDVGGRRRGPASLSPGVAARRPDGLPATAPACAGR